MVRPRFFGPCFLKRGPRWPKALFLKNGAYRKKAQPRFIRGALAQVISCVFYSFFRVFFFYGLRPRLIHATIGPVSLTFCRAIPSFFFFFFFCFPQTHFEPYHPLKSLITLHLSNLKPSSSPSNSDPKPSPHPPSPISPSTLASRSISNLHRHPPHQQQQLLRDPSQALTSASRPISPCQFSWHSQRHHRTP